MKETYSCFLRVACKAPRIQQNVYTVFEWIWQSNLQNFIFSDECFMRRWRLKYQVSKYRLRWNAENRTSSFMSHPKKITHQLLFLRALYDWKSTSLLNYYYIWPHLDARWFFLYGVLPPPQTRLKLFLFTPVFLDK